MGSLVLGWDWLALPWGSTVGKTSMWPNVPSSTDPGRSIAQFLRRLPRTSTGRAKTVYTAKSEMSALARAEYEINIVG